MIDALCEHRWQCCERMSQQERDRLLSMEEDGRLVRQAALRYAAIGCVKLVGLQGLIMKGDCEFEDVVLRILAPKGMSVEQFRAGAG